MRRSNEGSPTQPERGNFTPPRTAVSPGEHADRADTADDGSPVGSTSKLSPRNWRVATRLNAILLIPALVGLTMGGFQVKGSIDTWNEAQDAEKTALVVRAASVYGQALLNERDLTAQPLLKKESTDSVVTQSRAATDAAASGFTAAVADMPQKAGLQRRLKLFRGEEPKLAALRKAAYTTSLDPVKTEEGYTQIQHSLMEFANELGLGTGNVTSYGRTVYALELSQAAESLQRSIGLHLLVRPSEDETTFNAQVKAFGSYNYLEQIALGEFNSGGTQTDVNRLKTVMEGKAAEGAEQLKAAKEQAEAAGAPFVTPPGVDGSVFDGMAAQIGKGLSPSELKAKGITPETWTAASTAKFEGYATVTDELVDKAVDEAAQISSDAKTDAIVNASIVVVALLAAFVVAGFMARQMSRAMRRLRTAAFEVAEQRLPSLVDQLSRTDPGRVDTRVQPIPINTSDEIGEVARAFDQVHREAVRLASEQAMLRGNVNAIFTNLSRRNQSLIEGQLTLITDLENNEADPDQLESLFKLDHLATRMRRNGENLLVLAGEEPGRRWNQPVPLVDVLRAASSEVESYERIELTGVPDTEIHGQAVTDLVHLLAELLENATVFSSPQTKVRVTATRLPDGRVMIEIHDKGIGLTAEDFADINHKLANPPTVDAAVSQRMGLFVVGRLSDRHGVRVQLRPSGEQAGTTSLVMLPDAITHGGGGEPVAASDDFTVSSIIPEQQHPLPAAPQLSGMRTAAELGFDDSRYEPDSPTLDPVGRSLMREERRAALEAAHTAGEQSPFDGPGQDAPRQQFEQDGYPQAGYGQQPAYDRNGYPQGTFEQDSFEPGSYEQQGFGQTGHQETYAPYAADAGFRPDAEQLPQGGYPEQAYPTEGTQQPSYGDQFTPHGDQHQQGGWPEQGGFQAGYETSAQEEAESAPGAPEETPERVGFDHSGPTANAGHEMTDAGLPRRGGQQHWQPGGSDNARPEAANPPQRQDSPSAVEPQDGESTDDWRSTNDERWERAEQLRDPKAGGITLSGLPRRVPKANLVEGTAEQTQQGGPQVSRTPEDIRGRLSNLRRGIQQGRKQGSDSSNTYNQER
ncbi:nitrate- and nitrite sensing domain-containing protein [Streptomyces sp. NBC_00102]|uniref:sensor histidine kinase n=1 Tax=Streptomyces sp. NBC_00102 TaxID=2975652 RepID=UPI00224EB058|nr:nitrate- and nitrite sensing domain-containing protein [Streptomyces sp. NBC_00102]MCX5399979.1 nitrate- and nitrite sensing domain-containing protein [Streptomyces sp. NBC_00102]